MLPHQDSTDKGALSPDHPPWTAAEQVQAVARCLRVFVRPGQLAELRAPKTADGGLAGFFEYDQINLMAQHAVDLSGKAEAVYFTVNPIRRDADIAGIKRIGLNKLGPCRKGEHTED